MIQEVNKTKIICKLKELGVKPGISLEVHSSLRSFGYVSGGAQSVIHALQECVTADGAIVMPSFRFSSPYELSIKDKSLGIKQKIRLLDEDEIPSGMGVIADTFRTQPDVITGCGIFRVSAWGNNASKHAEGFGRIIENDGYTLLMGVDIYSMSSMHHVEEYLPEEIKQRFEVAEAVRKLYPEDRWLVEAWTPPCKPWYKIQSEAYEKGFMKDIMIGNSKCMFMRTGDVVALYKKALIEDPFGLYEIEPSDNI